MLLFKKSTNQLFFLLEERGRDVDHQIPFLVSYWSHAATVVRIKIIQGSTGVAQHELIVERDVQLLKEVPESLDDRTRVHLDCVLNQPFNVQGFDLLFQLNDHGNDAVCVPEFFQAVHHGFFLIRHEHVSVVD